jgi:hypothetical protein
VALEFRQLRDIDGYAPGLVAGEELGRRAKAAALPSKTA